VSTLWLSRARLRQDTGANAALARLLVPEGDGARLAAAHRLVWALFADGPERERDFLWREEAPGRFMTLSARAPQALPDLFDVQSKPFEPSLAVGDRLLFALCANAVVSRAVAPGQRGKPHDVVMDAIHRLPGGQRAGARLGAVAEAGRAWLVRQGQVYGFEPAEKVGVDGYETVRVPRDKGADARFGRLDFTGLLQVTDPAKFVAKLSVGFGRARAFGCGLMLIRRA
jgi:CRISPR system Cascade subunit CasE